MAATSNSESDFATDLPGDVRDATTFFQRRRPLFWAALAWMLGIVLDEVVALPTGKTLAALTIPLTAAALLFALKKGYRRKVWMLALIAVAGGVGTHAFLARILPSNHIARLTSEGESAVYLRGVLRDVARLDSGSARWTLDLESVAHSASNPKDCSGRVQLFVPRAPDGLREGSRVGVHAMIQKPRDTFPDDFDLVSYLRRESIHRTGTVDREKEIETDFERSNNPLLALRRLSATFSERLRASMPAWELEGRESGSQAALLSALLFGRKEHLDRADRDAFAATGTAHLLAISGLQIQFLAWLLWGLLRRMNFSTSRSALLLFSATWLYTALSGAEPPIVRAAVMISLALLGRALWRETDPLSLLGAAAIVILAAAPDQLFQAGFQLSFCAVFALVTLGPLFIDLLKQRGMIEQTLAPSGTSPTHRSLRGALLQIALVSFVAWIGTVPVIAWHMKQFSLFGIFANLLAVPLSSLAMIAGLLALTVGALSSTLAAPFVWAAFSLAALLQTFTDLVAALPLASIRIAAPHTLLLVAYAAGVLFLWMQRGLASTRIVSLTTCILLLASVGAGAFFAKKGPLAITALDLPRGRAVLVQNGPDAVLIDAGGPTSGARLARWIKDQGVLRLQKVLVTENEWGAHGGLIEIALRIPIEEVVLPVVASPDSLRRQLESELIARKIKWTSSPSLARFEEWIPGFKFQLCDDTLYSPNSQTTQSSIAVRIEHQSRSLLILPARSAASLDRFQANAPTGFLQASALFVPVNTFEKWPRNSQQVLERTAAANLLSTSPLPFKFNIPRSPRVFLLPNGSTRLSYSPDKPDEWRVESFSDGLWVDRK